MKILFKYTKTVLGSLNKQAVQAEYAVGGLPTQAALLRKKLREKPGQYDFADIVECNIGNPQIYGQKPNSFTREVVACCINPNQLNIEQINPDSRERARQYLNKTGSLGAYSETQGYEFIRENVTKFIQKRDGLKTAPKNSQIILTSGASEGIRMIFNLLVNSPQDGVMIPIPQYPLYSACISLFNSTEIPYYLNELDNWSISKQELIKQYEIAKSKGVTPKILVAINPGNPTGQVFLRQNIRAIIEFAYEYDLRIIADEVYQENVYCENRKFHSFSKVHNQMIEENSKYAPVEIYSVHSVSKGLSGECGFRAGYLQMPNIQDDDVHHEFYKLKTIQLCTNSPGQIVLDIMINPPSIESGCSQSTVQQYITEKQDLLNCLKHRAEKITSFLNTMKNVRCQRVEGAMYAFPKVDFSEKALREAESKQMSVDTFYCYEMLQKTGVVLVPGSGFRQQEGTYHFRTTTLVLPQTKLESTFDRLVKANNEFHEKY